MKFKINHNQFLRKKLIIGSLISSILTSNFNIVYSNALSERERYEVFEGNKLIIDNVLEEDIAEVEIDGKSVTNLVETRSVRLESRVYSTHPDGSSYYYYKNDAKLKIPLKANTTYTLYLKVTENSYDHTPFDSIVLGQGDRDLGMGHGLDGWSCRLYWEKDFNIEEESKNGRGLGHHRAVFTTSSRIEETSFLWIGFIGQSRTACNTMIEDITIVEGEHKIRDYVDGVKSVGQDDINGHGIEVSSGDENLLDVHLINQTGGTNAANGQIYPQMFVSSQSRCRTKDFIKVEPNTDYYFSSNNKYKFAIIEFDENNIQLNDSGWAINESGGVYRTSANTANIIVVIKRGDDANITPQTVYKDIKMTKSSKISSLKIPLNEPLRAVSNHIKDRIIKKDGEWFVERNCGEKTLNGSEEWHKNVNWVKDETLAFYHWLGKKKGEVNIISDRFKTEFVGSSKDKEAVFGEHYNTVVYIRIKKSRLSGDGIQAMRNWLSQNPVKVVYELETPIYEPLNIDSTIKLFLDRNIVVSNSDVSSKIRVAVDRVMNIAVECINIAKNNPTVENISQARYWTNLLKESIKKDELHNDLDDIYDFADKVISKKNSSVNSDIYIQSKNNLKISLDTNSILFDDVSIIENTERLKAINISVSSSLPYDLSVTMPNGITKSDGSNLSNLDLISVRESSTHEYKVFTSNQDEVSLKENCPAGMDNIHGIDLRLNAGRLNKIDVYKTTLKFEVEQR